jgi:hypothetical protein
MKDNLVDASVSKLDSELEVPCKEKEPEQTVNADYQKSAGSSTGVRYEAP